jgi:hypothetical protein
MSSLGYSSNRILQPIAGGANASGAHFTNAFGSMIGGVSGCAGAGNSPAALAAKPGYNWEKTYNHQKGGVGRAGVHRRGGNKRSHKRSGHKRSNKRSGHKRSNKKRSSHKKRGMRGGLSALSPASFSGAANLPYNQFTGNQPLSFTYDTVGAPLSPANSGLASPHIGTANNACGPWQRVALN